MSEICILDFPVQQLRQYDQRLGKNRAVLELHYRMVNEISCREDAYSEEKNQFNR